MAKREAEHKFTSGTVYRFLGHTSISRLTGLKIGDLLILPIGEALKVAHDAIDRLAQHGIKAKIVFEGSE